MLLASLLPEVCLPVTEVLALTIPDKSGSLLASLSE